MGSLSSAVFVLVGGNCISGQAAHTRFLIYLFSLLLLHVAFDSFFTYIYLSEIHSLSHLFIPLIADFICQYPSTKNRSLPISDTICGFCRARICILFTAHHDQTTSTRRNYDYDAFQVLFQSGSSVCCLPALSLITCRRLT